MTLQERKAVRTATIRQEKRKRLAGWLWLIPIAAAAVLLFLLSPTLNALADRVQHPPLRQDVTHVDMVSNSGSDAMLRPKDQVAREKDALHTALADRLGPVRTLLVRFASRPVELYNGPTDPDALIQVLKPHYLNARPDPQPGTFLAPALEYTLQRVPRDGTVVVTVGTDAWEDGPAVDRLLRGLKAQGRRLMLFAHGVPIHGVRMNKTQMDLRGEARKSTAALGEDACVASTADFADAVERWLPERLRAHGVRMN